MCFESVGIVFGLCAWNSWSNSIRLGLCEPNSAHFKPALFPTEYESNSIRRFGVFDCEIREEFGKLLVSHRSVENRDCANGIRCFIGSLIVEVCALLLSTLVYFRLLSRGCFEIWAIEIIDLKFLSYFLTY